MLRLVFVACALWCSIVGASAQQHPSLPDSTVPNGLGINIHFTQPLAGEGAAGVDDIHTHPAEKRSFRLGLTRQF